MVLSYAATNIKGGIEHDRDPNSDRRTQILLIDISRAFFRAKTDENDTVYADLPPEVGALPGMRVFPRRHMYGIRWAAGGW